MTDDTQNLVRTSVNVFGNSGHSGCEIQHSDQLEETLSANNNSLVTVAVRVRSKCLNVSNQSLHC